MSGYTTTLARQAVHTPEISRVFDLRPVQDVHRGAEPERSGGADGDQWLRLAVWSITKAVI